MRFKKLQQGLATLALASTLGLGAAHAQSTERGARALLERVSSSGAQTNIFFNKHDVAEIESIDGSKTARAAIVIGGYHMDFDQAGNLIDSNAINDGTPIRAGLAYADAASFNDSGMSITVDGIGTVNENNKKAESQTPLAAILTPTQQPTTKQKQDAYGRAILNSSLRIKDANNNPLRGSKLALFDEGGAYDDKMIVQTPNGELEIGIDYTFDGMSFSQLEGTILNATPGTEVVLEATKPQKNGTNTSGSTFLSHYANGSTGGNAKISSNIVSDVGWPRAITGGDPAFLNNGRFRVDMQYHTQNGDAGTMAWRDITDQTKYWFFDSPDNVEVVMKILDGGKINGNYWVFLTGLTDQAVDITVTDTTTGQQKTYSNPLKQAFQPVADINAFASNTTKNQTNITQQSWFNDLDAHSQIRTLQTLVEQPTTTKATGDLTLHNGLYTPHVTFKTQNGENGTMILEKLTDQTFYGHYGNPENIELVQKYSTAAKSTTKHGSTQEDSPTNK